MKKLLLSIFGYILLFGNMALAESDLTAKAMSRASRFSGSYQLEARSGSNGINCPEILKIELDEDGAILGGSNGVLHKFPFKSAGCQSEAGEMAAVIFKCTNFSETSIADTYTVAISLLGYGRAYKGVRFQYGIDSDSLKYESSETTFGLTYILKQIYDEPNLFECSYKRLKQ